MAITIPERQYAGFARLLRMTDAQWGALIKALQDSKPVLPLTRYFTNVSAFLEAQVKDAGDVLWVLASLFSLRDDFSGSPTELIGEIRDAAEKTEKAELKATKEEWSRFGQFLLRIFSEKTSLEVAAKAQDILYEEEKLISDVRIISDLRPVYRGDISPKPEAFLVAHMLKIEFHEADGHKEIYLSLDRGDLTKLQKVVVRALQKETALKSLVTEWGVPYLGEIGDP